MLLPSRIGLTMSSSLLLLFLLFLARGGPQQFIAQAQEFPNPLYTTNQFNTTKSFRQNVCDRYNAYFQNQIPFAEALEGLELSAIIRANQYFELRGDGSIDPEYPGLTGVLMDELARRAKFTWRDSFTTLGAPEGNNSFTDLLLWNVETYDLSVNWWTWNTERRSLGINFPVAWYDASIIMVGKQNLEESGGFDAFSWIAPFDLYVWIMILVCILYSGLVYFFLERIDKKTDKRNLKSNPMNSIFLSGLTFTSHFEFRPRTQPAMLFTLSLSFWAMLTGAAYTANLASFLVVKNTPKLQVSDVKEAVNLGLRLCVYKDTAADDLVSQEFPYANLVRKETEEEIYKGVVEGDCAIALTPDSSWEFWQRKQETNPECALEWIGRTFKQRPAGFATLHDSGQKCTSLLNDVINIHLGEMEEENFIENAWKNHVERTATNEDCSQAGAETLDTASDSSTLNLQNMGGIFILHFSVSIVAILLAVAFKVFKVAEKRDQKDKAKKEQEELRKYNDSIQVAEKWRKSCVGDLQLQNAAEQATAAAADLNGGNYFDSVRVWVNAAEQARAAATDLNGGNSFDSAGDRLEALTLGQAEMKRQLDQKMKTIDSMQEQMSAMMKILQEKKNA